MALANSHSTSDGDPRRGPFYRLLVTIWLDMRLQWRNGFYAASLFVLALLALVFPRLGVIPQAWFLPLMVVSNMPLNTFYFLGALVLLEKGEGTLEAQVVSPLRTWEYLAAKIFTLTVLSLVEAVVIVMIVFGLQFNLLLFALGVMQAAVLFCLVGFLVVIRYDSINAYLIPSVFFLILLLLPLLETAGLMSSPLFYLHPFQPALVLLNASFGVVPAWQVVYGLVVGALWLLILARLSFQSFAQFVVRRAGVRLGS